MNALFDDHTTKAGTRGDRRTREHDALLELNTVFYRGAVGQDRVSKALDVQSTTSAL